MRNGSPTERDARRGGGGAQERKAAEAKEGRSDASTGKACGPSYRRPVRTSL